MIKFLLGIAIIGFTTLCGRMLAKKYRVRRDFFKQFKEFNERFLSEISYARRPLKDFVYAYTYQGEFQELLRDYFQALENDYDKLRVFVERAKYSFLTEEETRILENYFLMLGKGDSASQKGYFSSVSDTLSKLNANGEKDAKRYGDLYVKIGFLCGLLILILIV